MPVGNRCHDYRTRRRPPRSDGVQSTGSPPAPRRECPRGYRRGAGSSLGSPTPFSRLPRLVIPPSRSSASSSPTIYCSDPGRTRNTAELLAVPRPAFAKMADSADGAKGVRGLSRAQVTERPGRRIAITRRPVGETLGDLKERIVAAPIRMADNHTGGVRQPAQEPTRSNRAARCGRYRVTRSRPRDEGLRWSKASFRPCTVRDHQPFACRAIPSAG